MKRPQEEIATSRKTLPARRSKKNPAGVQEPATKKTAQRRRVLQKGSDEELIKVFGEK